LEKQKRKSFSPIPNTPKSVDNTITSGYHRTHTNDHDDDDNQHNDDHHDNNDQQHYNDEQQKHYNNDNKKYYKGSVYFFWLVSRKGCESHK
jgi:hypothetical protein